MDYLIERIQCPACSEAKSEEIYSCEFLNKPIYQFIKRKFEIEELVLILKDARYRLHECKNCFLIYQKEILNEAMMVKLYNEWLNFYDAEKFDKIKKFNFKKASYFAQEIVKIIRYLNKEPYELDVLDYGMGWGRWCYMANAYGCHSYGTDLSMERISHAKSKGISVMNANEIDQYKFDYINIDQVFEHIPNPKETLTYLANSLKNGGIIKISVPDGRNIKKKLRIMDWTARRSSKKFLMPITPLIHINCFDYKSLVLMANKAGLKHIRVPLRYEYSNLYIMDVMNTLKSLVRPFYRRFRKKTHLFFKKL